jgi:hypothetical protein
MPAILHDDGLTEKRRRRTSNWWCPNFKVARLALRGAAGRSATRPTKFGHYRQIPALDRPGNSGKMME